jgi:hypothetical protein
MGMKLLAHEEVDYEQTAYVRFWPNPAVQLSISSCRGEKSRTVTTGSNQPKAVITKADYCSQTPNL